MVRAARDTLSHPVPDQLPGDQALDALVFERGRVAARAKLPRRIELGNVLVRRRDRATKDDVAGFVAAGDVEAREAGGCGKGSTLGTQHG